MTQQLRQQLKEIAKKYDYWNNNVLAEFEEVYNSEVIEMLEAAYSLDRQGWISVDERLPDDEREDVICGGESGVYYNSFRYNKRTKRFENYDHPFGVSDITHWMPLPKPPQS